MITLEEAAENIRKSSRVAQLKTPEALDALAKAYSNTAITVTKLAEALKQKN